MNRRAAPSTVRTLRWSAAALTFAGLLALPAVAQLGGSWTRKAPLPAPRSEVAAVALDGRIYAVGGSDAMGNAVATNSAYDPATDSWQTRAPLPRALHHVGLAALGGKVYAVGGFTANVHIEPQATLYAYDPKQDQWQQRANMPAARASVAVVAVDGKLHVLGGRDSRTFADIRIPNAPPMKIGQGTLRTHEVYDPKSDTWTKASDIPGPPRDHVGAAVLDGKIYLFGGRIEGNDQNLDRLDIFDPRTGRWTTGAALPNARSAGAFTVLDGRILYAGGECKAGVAPGAPGTFDDVAAYDPRANRWTVLAPLPQGGRHGFGAGTVGRTAYFVGGSPGCGGGQSADVYALKLQ